MRHARERTGGVTFDATTRQVYAANLSLRTATRIVIRAARFRASTFATLEDEVRALDWRAWIRPGSRVRVRATSTASALYHTGAIEERVARFVGGRPADEPNEHAASGGRGGDRDVTRGGSRRARPNRPRTPEADDGEQLLIVRIVHDEVTISVDSSGEALYKRGWRQATAKAPLRETLAAAMLVSAGWDPATPLIDPMCGSGTIPIEAARFALGIPTGQSRAFAFDRWPSFEPGTWASVAGAARAASAPARGEGEGPGTGDDVAGDAAEVRVGGISPTIIGRDRNAGAIDAAVANAGRAAVQTRVQFTVAPISDLVDLVLPGGGHGAPRPGWILTNPPYGARVQGGADLRDLYARFGSVARTRFPGWRVGMLVADPALAAHTKFRLEAQWHTANGGIPVQFLTATI